MQGLSMPVRSRLKLVIARHNLERMERGETPLTTREIAEHTGLAHSTVTGVSSGRLTMISYRTIAALCAFFKVTPGDLFEYYEEEPEGETE
jgi:DNA-binding Xre family transcriptional regulator